MALYTFYPCKLDDTALAFDAHELNNDGEALGRALQVLDEHPSAAFVVVWCGDRKVLTRPRVDHNLKDVLTRPPAADAGA